MAAVGTEAGESISLNIMPMMDVFSILIAFLLMSYSTDPVNVDQRKGLELPASQTIAGLDELPAIAVTQTEILVNDKKVANVMNGEVPEGERAQGAVQALYDELVKLKERNDQVRKSQGKAPKLGVITMEMDKSHPFKLAKRVMLSAQQAEFITFKLMVSRNGDF